MQNPVIERCTLPGLSGQKTTNSHNRNLTVLLMPTIRQHPNLTRPRQITSALSDFRRIQPHHLLTDMRQVATQHRRGIHPPSSPRVVRRHIDVIKQITTARPRLSSHSDTPLAVIRFQQVNHVLIQERITAERLRFIPHDRPDNELLTVFPNNAITNLNIGALTHKQSRTNLVGLAPQVLEESPATRPPTNQTLNSSVRLLVRITVLIRATPDNRKSLRNGTNPPNQAHRAGSRELGRHPPRRLGTRLYRTHTDQPWYPTCRTSP